MSRSLRIAAALLLALAPAGVARAQSEASPKAAAEPAAAEPQPFPLAEVTLRAQETRRELSAMAERLQPTADMKSIDERLSARSEVVENAAATTQTRLAAPSLPLSTLVDMEREWETRRQSLAIWEEQITARRAALDREVARLAELSARWRLTHEAARAGDSSSAVETCQRVIQELKEADASAQKRAKAIDGLQLRVGKPMQIATDRLHSVQRVRDEKRSRLFQGDEPPLWQVYAEARDADTVLAEVGEDLDHELDALRAYVELRGPRLGQTLGVAIATFLLALALRRRLASWTEEDPALDQAVYLFRRPVSIALLVLAVYAALFLTLAPEAVGDTIRLLLLVPAARLLPGLVPGRLRPAVWAVLSLVLAAQIRDFLAAAPVLSRLLLTLEIVGGLAFFGWLVPRSAPTLPPEQRIHRPVALLVRVFLLALGIAFVGNLFGWVGLAALLVRGVVTTAYAALIFYALVRMLRIALRVILHARAAQQLRMVSAGSGRIEQALGHLAALLAFGAWIHLSLQSFAIRDGLYAWVGALLTTKAGVGALHVSLGDVLTFAGVIAASFYLARLIRFVLEEDVFPRFEWERGIPNAIATSAQYTVLIFGLLLALGAAGVDISRITLLAGAFGVGIGFGLQNIVNNFVSGLILLFERPIQVGDTIEVQGLMGEVRRIGPRSSTVRSFDGAEVIVPNGTLISDNVVNWTLSDRRRRVILPLTLARGSDPDQVLQILREVADANETVLKDPGPLVRFCGYSDGALSFELRAWIPRFEEGFGVQTALWTDLERRFLAADIQVPFPQRDVHVHGAEREHQTRPGIENR